jgi:YlmC/YmxH family sporulation protein
MYELRQKEVINIKDGCRFGFVCDLCIDEEEGCVEKLIVPGPGKLFGVFGPEQEYHIPWDKVKKIGEDIILVEVETGKITVHC